MVSWLAARVIVGSAGLSLPTANSPWVKPMIVVRPSRPVYRKNTKSSPEFSVGAPANDCRRPLATPPGTVAADAPLVRNGKPTWLLRELGPDFTLLVFGDAPMHGIDGAMKVLRIGPGLADATGLAAQRYDAQPGTAYLVRPDHHVCARWRAPTAVAIRAAIDRACARA